jgi:hypothetical protein
MYILEKIHTTADRGAASIRIVPCSAYICIDLHGICIYIYDVYISCLSIHEHSHSKIAAACARVCACVCIHVYMLTCNQESLPRSLPPVRVYVRAYVYMYTCLPVINSHSKIAATRARDSKFGVRPHHFAHSKHVLHVCIHVCMYAHMYVCMYVCTYV